MINFKNILKVLLIALFVCAWSGDVRADKAATTSTTSATNSTTVTGQGGSNDPSYCGQGLGIFTELVQTGQMIFNRLRDLIYVVAGFGIIAVAVGGFFGNLNWKWLGAIVISLVVIASAGELIVLLTGCERYSSSLITNTLTNPTPTMTTEEYNKAYTEEAPSKGKISWDDTRDMQDYYSSSGDFVPASFDATDAGAGDGDE